MLKADIISKLNYTKKSDTFSPRTNRIYSLGDCLMLQVTPELHENWDLVFSVYPFALSIQHRALHLLGGPQLWLNDWIHYLKLEKGK